MADGDRWYIRLLDRLGVNTTRMRWRLYQREQRANRMLDGETHSPVPPWWHYPNKICPHCRAVNHRDSRTCDSCGRRVPSMWGYRVRRLVSSVLPDEGPVVAMTFLGVMVLFWIAQILLDGVGLSSVMGPSEKAIHVLGAFTPAYAVREGQFWRFMAFGLVHGGLFHIGMNSYFLVQIGPLLEAQLTRGRMLVLITLSQLTSAIACYVWYGEVMGIWYQQPVVGASGWLFGLLGFGIVFAHRAGIQPMRDSLIRSAAFMFVLGFVVNSYASGGGISNSAHFGGLIGGLAFGVLPEGGRRSTLFGERAWNAAAAVSLGLWIATLVFVVRYVVIYWPQINAAR
jgi:membrane associated rhomboid family serine protease